MCWQRNLVSCPFVQQFLRCPFVDKRMCFHPFEGTQNVRWRVRCFWDVRPTRIVSVLIGHIWKLDASSVGRIPMGRSLSDYAANTSLLGENVIGRFVLVRIRSVIVDLLRACGGCVENGEQKKIGCRSVKNDSDKKNGQVLLTFSNCVVWAYRLADTISEALAIRSTWNWNQSELALLSLSPIKN